MTTPTTQARWSGWSFPARITAVFLAGAAITVTTLAIVGLSQFRSVNADHTSIRIDRAARAAAALVGTGNPDFVIDCDSDGSPVKVMLDSADRLVPGDNWDAAVDQVSSVNQGAANVFRYDAEGQSFDRIATSFTTPDGDRVGGSTVEPGLIQAGHPAFDSLTAAEPYVGEVPVAGRMRYAYLTPIVDPDQQLVGALAVDVGWVDDLTRVNDELGTQVFIITSLLLLALALGAGLVMFIAFRPLNRLIRVAHDLGNGVVPAENEVPLTDRGGEIGELATALAQVVQLHGDLADRASHDDLTGLPNRRQFLHELEQRIDRLKGCDDAFALLLIDLDQFKEINDGLGHAAGDELLVALADALEDDLGPTEFLARLGGDEFALITGPVISEVDADQVAGRVSDTIKSVTRISIAQLSVTGSIGIVVLPQQADTAEIALSHADLALYRAKRAGRAHWQFYQSTLASPIQRRMHLATELRKAIDRNELRCEYQPIVDIEARELRGFEALARWDHPTEGAIPPVEFITVAENAGLINELGNHIIDHVCAQASQWSEQGFGVPTISVNVSSTQLWQHDFVHTVKSCLARHGLTPEALCLELTESIVVHHADGRNRQILQRLAEMGIRLSLDDFGTGYSSLSYLRDLDVHELKIDRRFIVDAQPGTDSERLFEGIASLGRSLGLSVVAEGIETEAEFELARRHGCHLAQGYLISRPLRPEQTDQLFSLPTRRHAHAPLP